MVFARVGTALFIIPGFGGTKLNARARLSIAVTIAFLVTPVLAGKLPSMPGEPLNLLLLMEIVMMEVKILLVVIMIGLIVV